MGKDQLKKLEEEERQMHEAMPKNPIPMNPKVEDKGIVNHIDYQDVTPKEKPKGGMSTAMDVFMNIMKKKK